MTTFSVYKIHAGPKKNNNTSSKGNLMQNRKDSHNSIEDKSLKSLKDKKEEVKKTQRPKNVIRRETQEKLKNLYQLFCKVIDDKGEC